MAYLPISKEKAMQLVAEKLESLGIEYNSNKLVADLIYRGSSPYYPDWHLVSHDGTMEFYVTQAGVVIFTPG